MIARYVLYSIVWLFATVIGIFLLPFILLVTNKYATRLPILDNVYGNEVDGLRGDLNYQNNQAKTWYRKHWSRYYWLAARNPTHNLLLNTLSVEGVIANIKYDGDLTVVTFDTGKKAFLYYNKGDRYLVKFGWKLWSDQIKLGQFYKAEFVLNP